MTPQSEGWYLKPVTRFPARSLTPCSTTGSRHMNSGHSRKLRPYQVRRETSEFLAKHLSRGTVGWPRRGTCTLAEAMERLEQPDINGATRPPRVWTTKLQVAARTLLRTDRDLSAKQVHWMLIARGFSLGSERSTRYAVANLRRSLRVRAHSSRTPTVCSGVRNLIPRNSETLR